MADNFFKLKIAGTGNGSTVTYGSFNVQKPQNYTNNEAYIGQHPLTDTPAQTEGANTVGPWTEANAGKLLSCFEIDWGGAIEGWKEESDANWDSGLYTFPDSIKNSSDLLRYIFMLRWKLEHMQPLQTFTITWDKNGATSWSATGATTSFSKSIEFSSLTKPIASRVYTYKFGTTTKTYTYTHDNDTDWGTTTSGSAFSGNLLLQNYKFYALWHDGSWNDTTIPNIDNNVTRTIIWDTNGGTAGSNGTTQYYVGTKWQDEENTDAPSSLQNIKPTKSKEYTAVDYLKTSSFTIAGNPSLSEQTFKGWFTAKSEGIQINTSNITKYLSLTENTTFYAQYDAIPATYYWYVGNDIQEPTSTITVTTGNNSGWRKIDKSLANVDQYTSANPLWNGANNPIQTGLTTVGCYLYLPKEYVDAGLGVYDGLSAAALDNLYEKTSRQAITIESIVYYEYFLSGVCTQFDLSIYKK